MKEKDYLIEFPKLRSGLNEFTFQLNDAFLKDFEGSQLEHADVTASLSLVKSETMLNLQFSLKGTIEVQCDICLDPFKLPVDNSFNLIMKISEVEDYSDDEIIYITPNLVEYDVKQYLYECLVLSVPIRKVCAMSVDGKECNPETVSKLKENNDHEGDDKGSDPRWDKLKEMFN